MCFIAIALRLCIYGIYIYVYRVLEFFSVDYLEQEMEHLYQCKTHSFKNQMKSVTTVFAENSNGFSDGLTEKMLVC